MIDQTFIFIKTPQIRTNIIRYSYTFLAIIKNIIILLLVEFLDNNNLLFFDFLNILIKSFTKLFLSILNFEYSFL